MLPMASVSKSFIALALTRAVDKGLLSLDDPVNKHLDFVIPTWPGSRAITVRDLARHESGFEERWLATGSAGDKPDPRPWPQILAGTFPKLIAPPGEYASYSNYGAALLAYVIQRAAKWPYAEFLDQEVLGPLGMRNTSMLDPLPSELAARQLAGWEVSNGIAKAPKRTFNTRSAPAGRMHATLPDMVRYMRFLMGEGTVPSDNVGTVAPFLRADSLHEMLTPGHRVHPAMPGIGTLFAEKDIAGMRFVGHGGDGNSHHTDLLVSRKDGIGLYMVFLSAPGPQARDNLTRAVLQGLRLAPESVPLAVQNPAKDLSRFAGAYRTYRWAETSIERILQLSSEFAIRATPRGTLIVTGRLGQGEYVPDPGQDGLFLHRTNGDLMHLRSSSEGRMRMVVGNYPFVTSYKLDEVNTQGFTTTAYWSLLAALGLVAALTLATALRDWRRAAPSSAAGLAVLSVSWGTCCWVLWFFVAKANAMSEPEVQERIPDIAYWLLGVPPFALSVTLAWLLAVATGRVSPAGKVSWLVAALGMAVFAAFIAFIAHWNALGWNFP
jgi:CubicO group peptidase (beta-lactamase class C family)